jgi:hypothetical protein
MGSAQKTAHFFVLFVLSLLFLGLAETALGVEKTTSSASSQDVEKAAAPASSQDVEKAAAPASSQDVEKAAAPKRYSNSQVAIVSITFGLMCILFAFLFYWQNRLEQAGFFGHIYRDTIEAIESGRLAAPKREKWKQGAYIYELLYKSTDRAIKWLKANELPTPNEELRKLAELLGYSDRLHETEWDLRWRLVSIPRRFGSTEQAGNTDISEETYLPGLGTSSGIDSSGTKSISPDENRYRQLRSQFIENQNRWIAQATECAWSWYQQEMQSVKIEAVRQAKRALHIDFSSLRGRGAEFVLEFTAVVVIIFSAVILGVLDILQQEQIGTLLAAIAGYVLGRATTRARSGVSETPSQPNRESSGSTAAQLAKKVSTSEAAHSATGDNTKET